MDEDQVQDAVLRKVSELERFYDQRAEYYLKNYSKDPDRLEEALRSNERCRNLALDEEWNYYSRVEVVKYKNRWYLCYPDTPEGEGTGGFETKTAAVNWFTGLGR